MRFALLEIKEILVKTLKSYDINPCSSTPKELVFDDDFTVRKPKSEIKVIFSKRLSK